MKSVEQGFVFSPELRIFDAGEFTNIVFDTQSPVDAMRSAKMVRVEKGLKQLSFQLSGFDTPQDDGARREISGVITLVMKDSGGNDTTAELAECKLTFNAAGKPDKQGGFDHIDPKLVEYAVRQAVSDAFTAAITDYFEQMPGVASGVAPAAPQEASSLLGHNGAQPASRRERRQSEAANASRIARGRRRATILAWTVPPLLALAIFAGISKLAQQPSPIQNAVAQQMANDPESIKAQVDLTLQTLKSMGLDPGKGGDLGCLAPQ